jgi:hypothetical protein
MPKSERCGFRYPNGVRCGWDRGDHPVTTKDLVRRRRGALHPWRPDDGG